MKEIKQVSENKGNTRDFVIANKVSGSIHGGLSKIRLSLTFRIALHYCVQLFRSFIPIFLIVSLLLILGICIPVKRNLEYAKKLTVSENGMILDDHYMTIQITDVPAENGFFPRLNQQFGVFFHRLFSDECVTFYYSAGMENEWLVFLYIQDFLRIWVLASIGIALGDIFRMLYFFRHNQRLNKRVLSPIREIASMAETLSESNLSNRINIAGTKNELKDLATVINRMLDRIERSYNSQKQFVSDASHELRTPISVIRGYTDMLKRWGKDDPEVLEEGITAISQETEGMKDLVESLLFLARHDKKTLMMEVSEFDPSELMYEVLKEEKMVHTEHVFAAGKADSFIIKADRNMLKQVLRILCDNAVKYSPSGSTVTLLCEQTDNQSCCLSVRDEGEGIPEDELPKIFDRFYRSDKARKAEAGGHGLGLSIARIIVVAHKGKLRVRSKPGFGSVFSVLLPLN